VPHCCLRGANGGDRKLGAFVTTSAPAPWTATPAPAATSFCCRCCCYLPLLPPLSPLLKLCGTPGEQQQALAQAAWHSRGAGRQPLTSNRPRLGLSFPDRTLSAVDLPMPLVPTRPSTCPGRGMGSLQARVAGLRCVQYMLVGAHALAPVLLLPACAHEQGRPPSMCACAVLPAWRPGSPEEHAGLCCCFNCCCRCRASLTPSLRPASAPLRQRTCAA